MDNASFWDTVRSVIEGGFTPEGLAILDRYAEQFIDGRLVYKRFSRSNSMAAQREVRSMSLHPYSREQKLKQIRLLKEGTVSKENSNKERNKLGG